MYFNLGGFIFNKDYLQSLRKSYFEYINGDIEYQIILNKGLDTEEVFLYKDKTKRDEQYDMIANKLGEKDNAK